MWPTGIHGNSLSIIEDLKARAKAAGLWNLFLPDKRYGAIGFDECQVDGHFGHLC